MKKGLILGCLLMLISSNTITSCNSNKTFANDKLVVGMECAYAPFNWTEYEANDNTLPIDNVNGYADGYDIQIAKYLSQKLEIPVVIKKYEWEALLTGITIGDINCIIAGMSYSEERDLTIDFTNNYYTSQMTVIVRKDSTLANITNIQELGGYKVVSQRATLTDDIIDQIQNVNHQTPLDSFNVAALAVSSGTADAMTAEYPVARAIVNANSNLTLVTFTKENGFTGLDDNELGVAVGIQEGNKELQDKINQALSELTEQERLNMMNAAIDRAPGE